MNKRPIYVPGSSVVPSMIAIALAASFVFAILTLWVPAYWPVSIFETLVFTLAVAVLIHGRSEWRFPRYPLFVFVFAVGWGILQIALGETAYAFATERSLLRWTTFLAVYLTGTYIFQDAETLRWFRAAMVWFGFVVAIEAILQSFMSPGYIFWIFPSGYGDNASIMGPILYHSHYAAFVETILPIAIYSALTDKRRPYAYAVTSAALYASVIVSASRAGFILVTTEVMIVLMVFYVRTSSRKRIDRLSALRLAALAAVFLLVVGWGSLSQRLAEANPMAGRREFAISSLHMIAARPWFGFGLGTWSTVYPRYAVIDLGDAFVNQAHSDWLQWGAEGGLPLLIAMVSLVVWTIPPAFRSIWGLGVIAVFVHACVDYLFSRPAIGAWPILVLAMLAVYGREEDRLPQTVLPFRKSQHRAS
ncbi:MAG: O-antigen ligase family protein [Acidobacteriaceae bacterium]